MCIGGVILQMYPHRASDNESRRGTLAYRWCVIPSFTNHVHLSTDYCCFPTPSATSPHVIYAAHYIVQHVLAVSVLVRSIGYYVYVIITAHC